MPPTSTEFARAFIWSHPIGNAVGRATLTRAERRRASRAGIRRHWITLSDTHDRLLPVAWMPSPVQPAPRSVPAYTGDSRLGSVGLAFSSRGPRDFCQATQRWW